MLSIVALVFELVTSMSTLFLPRIAAEAIAVR